MHIRRQIKYLAPVALMLLCTAMLCWGCRGKEEKQAALPVSPGPGQQESVLLPAPSGKPSGESPAIPPEVMADTPPQVTSIKVTPGTPTLKDSIKALIGVYDKEGDNITLAYYWYRNGELLPETSDTLSGGFRRGDKITLTVVPDDGKRKGNHASVLVTIANSPPAIKASADTHAFNGREYTYQVKATDPDGDPLTYSLKSAPAGMTIDPATGLVRWKITPDYSGTIPYIVAVADGNGGEGLLELSFEVRRSLKTK